MICAEQTCLHCFASRLTHVYLSPSYFTPLQPLYIPQVVGKADLVSILKDKTGVSKKDCEAVLGALSEAVKEEVLGSAKEIRLRDFGTFKQKVSKARMGRNPRTGEELQIKGSKSVGFSVAAAMKVKN